jgi:predicted SnoaL-like aldol condensation-catalyzing enzyme
MRAGARALVTTVALALAVPAVAAEPGAPRPACGRTIDDIASGFVSLFYDQGRVREAYETYVAKDYIQHNPHATDGRDSAIAFLEPFYQRNPTHRMTVHRVIVQDPYIVVHLHGQTGPEDRGAAAVDILRVENCLIAEHWDVTQPVPETSANKNGMF